MRVDAQHAARHGSGTIERRHFERRKMRGAEHKTLSKLENCNDHLSVQIVENKRVNSMHTTVTIINH